MAFTGVTNSTLFHDFLRFIWSDTIICLMILSLNCENRKLKKEIYLKKFLFELWASAFIDDTLILTFDSFIHKIGLIWTNNICDKFKSY